MSGRANLKVGDMVEVLDEGLAMLRRVCPGQPPNNIGTVAEIRDDGDIEVHFPLPGENHSQAAIYPKELVRLCRALESDVAAREADINGLVGLLLLRQSSLLTISADHPHKDVIEQARDSAKRELLWRFKDMHQSVTPTDQSKQR